MALLLELLWFVSGQSEAWHELYPCEVHLSATKHTFKIRRPKCEVT